MTDQNISQPSNINVGSIEGLVNVSEVHLNVSQEVIVTTEDKIRLCLSRHLNRMEKKSGWIAPLGVFITIIITLVTTSFNKVIFEPLTWEAIFIISGIITSGWLIYSIIQALKSKRIEDVIEELKKDPKSLKKPES